MKEEEKQEKAYSVVIDALNYRRRILGEYLASKDLPELHRIELEIKMEKLNDISIAFY